MVTFHSDCRHIDGVTLVTVALTDVAEPTRATLENRLDGPVWPPRRQGLPEAGWTDTGFEAVLESGRHAFGYASPAPPADPAVELVDATPAPDAEPARERRETPAGVTRNLGDPSPPLDALPSPSSPSEDGSPDPPVDDSRVPSDDLPDAVAAYFETVRGRVARAEALAAAESLDEATDGVRDAGGLDGVRSLDASQRGDERALRAIARRADALADRRAEATIPTATLARLA